MRGRAEPRERGVSQSGRRRTWPFLFLTRAHLLLHFLLTYQIFVFLFPLSALLIINELQVVLIASSLKENCPWINESRRFGKFIAKYELYTA